LAPFSNLIYDYLLTNFAMSAPEADVVTVAYGSNFAMSAPEADVPAIAYESGIRGEANKHHFSVSSVLFAYLFRNVCPSSGCSASRI
jgi:hypothetical protein